ncbi:MAG: peptidyl-prolyl cis-trans isomerase [Candidatus Fermentibacteraceae bacterium]|nr:peptidyl-prolyl cis-trans isomerase [Candidatus Fermentibacteraceae bacterium]MBN2607838.1 peptidyl-prolyl cis-trans isomerase [Candidatus Fermentibacteraceae bacterium]
MLRAMTLFALVLIVNGCGGGPAENVSGQDPDDEVIMNVAGQTITAGRISPLLEGVRGDSAMVEHMVNNLVNRFLILQDARDRGLDTTRSFSLYAYEREREKLQSMWFEWILQQKVVLPPDTVEEYYSRMGDMVLYTAISSRDSVLADSLRRLVLGGEDMNRMALEHTANMMERSSEGRVGPIDMMDLRTPDDMLLSGLEPGDLSPVALASDGYRFVRLDSTYYDSPPPISEIRELIESRILGRLRMDYKDELFDSLRTANDFQMEEEMLQLITSHYPQGGRIYEPFTPEEEEMVAYSYRGGSRTVYQLVENIRNLPPVEGTDPSDPAWLSRYSALLGLYDIMAMEAREQRMDTLPEVREYLEQRLSNHLLDVYYSQVIEPRLIVGEDEMMEVFQANRDSLTVPESRVFRAISAVGENQLQILEETLERGDDPFLLTDELTLLPDIQAPGEETLTRSLYVYSIPQPYSDMLFGAELNETVICSLTADRVLVFEPVVIEPRRPATFEESFDEITSMLRNQMEEEVLAGLVDSLASVYHIEIDREFIDGFIHSAPPSQDVP